MHYEINSGGNFIAGKGTRTFWPRIVMDLSVTIESFPFHGAQVDNIWDDRRDPLLLDISDYSSS